MGKSSSDYMSELSVEVPNFMEKFESANQRDAALAERVWLAHELAELSTNEVET